MATWRHAHENRRGNSIYQSGRLNKAYGWLFVSLLRSPSTGTKASAMAGANGAPAAVDDDTADAPPANYRLMNNPKEALLYYRGFVKKERAEHKQKITPGWSNPDAPPGAPKARVSVASLEPQQEVGLWACR